MAYSELATAKQRTWPWLLVGSLISLVCLCLVFRQVSIKDCWHGLAQLDPGKLWLPIVVTILAWLVRPYRWHLIFPEPARPCLGVCFTVLAVGNMVNNIVPARGGDLLRCVLIGQGQVTCSTSLAVATLALEKVLDGLMLVFILVCALPFLSSPRWFSTLTGISGAVFAGALGLLFVLWYRQRWLLDWVTRMFTRVHLPRLGTTMCGLLGRFVAGLTAVGSTGHLTQIVLMTALVWATDAAGSWTLAWSLNISLGFFEAAIVSAVIGLGQTLPAAPASLGTYEAFAVASLTLFGIEPAQAVPLALLLHLWTFVQTNGIGMLCLFLAGWRLPDMVRPRLWALGTGAPTIVGE